MRKAMAVLLGAKTSSASLLLGVISTFLLAPGFWVAGQGQQTDGPSGLEGSWQWLKSKDGDAEWVDRSKDLLRMKHITRTHFVYLEVNPESKQVTYGGGGHCTIKGDSYKETVTYYAVAGNKDAVGTSFDYTWHFKGEELHLTWTDGKQQHQQVWRRLAK